MRRINKISSIIIVILILLFYLIFEPCNYIPFSDCPKYYSELEFNQTNKSNTKYSQLLQLKIDSLLNKSIDEKDFLGISIGIYKHEVGEIISHAGLRNKFKTQKIDNNSLFRIASISKPMTAAAILHLKSKSMFDLNDPIKEHLNYLSIDSRITIEHLLNHTSGLPHYKSNIKSLNFTKYSSLIDASKVIDKLELRREPGSEYHYSGFGYLLLGALIEQKTNMSYSEYMKLNLWNTSNMNYTSTNSIENANEANLYLKYKNSFLRSPKDNLSSKLSGGGVLSTSDDMIKFSKAVLSYEIFDSLTIKEIFLKRYEDGNSDYVFGWHTDNNNYGRILYHGGALSGSSAYLRIYLDQGLAIVCLSNSSYSNQEVRYLTRNISHLFLEQEGLKNKLNEIKNDPKQIEEWW